MKIVQSETWSDSNSVLEYCYFELGWYQVLWLLLQCALLESELFFERENNSAVLRYTPVPGTSRALVHVPKRV
jgi:hypothetical protein